MLSYISLSLSPRVDITNLMTGILDKWTWQKKLLFSSNEVSFIHPVALISRSSIAFGRLCRLCPRPLRTQRTHSTIRGVRLQSHFNSKQALSRQQHHRCGGWLPILGPSFLRCSWSAHPIIQRSDGDECSPFKVSFSVPVVFFARRDQLNDLEAGVNEDGRLSEILFKTRAEESYVWSHAKSFSEAA